MIALLYTIHVLICFFLIAVVLLQQGKGADLSVFGGGATQTAFGARGAATVLHKMTVISFVLFILTTLGIGVYQSKQSTSGIFEGLDEEAAATATAGDESEAAADDGTEEPAEEPEGAFAVDAEEGAADEGADEAGADEGTGGEPAAGDATDTAAEEGGGEGEAGSDDASSGSTDS